MIDKLVKTAIEIKSSIQKFERILVCTPKGNWNAAREPRYHVFIY